jgi:hypothetical protein
LPWIIVQTDILARLQLSSYLVILSLRAPPSGASSSGFSLLMSGWLAGWSPIAADAKGADLRHLDVGNAEVLRCPQRRFEYDRQ